MTRRQTAMYWTATFAAFVLFMWFFGGMLSPFLFGAAIAYFADPVADWLERKGLSRVLATLLITASVFLISVVALTLLVPPLIDQALRLIANAPAYLERAQAISEVVLSSVFPDYSPTDSRWLEGDSQEAGGAAKKLGLTALKGVLSGGIAFVDFLGVFLITPVIAFYLLMDWDRMIARIDEWLPRRHAETVRGLTREIDTVLSGFLRGQISVCVILGSFYAVALSLIGLEFGLLVGIFAGFVSFIPFLGSIAGLVVSFGLALAQFWGEWWWIGAVVAVFLVGQLVEGNVLTPLLVGGSVGLHPVWLIFALSAFGYAFGFVGLLVAVPLAAVIGVLARWTLDRYLESDLYAGASD